MTEGQRGSRRVEHVDWNRKTKPELMDLLKRQETLLANKKFIERLPDKGEKVRRLRQDISEAISKLESLDVTTKLIQRLKITNPEKNLDSHDDDSDNGEDRISNGDGESDIFKTLASNGPPQKIIIKHSVPSIDQTTELKPEQNTAHDDPFVGTLTKKLENKQISAAALHEGKLTKLNKSITESPTKPPSEIFRGKYFVNGIWIETGVTPPPAKFAEAKTISYEESYQLQKEQAEKQSELQIVITATHLADRMSLCRIDGTQSSLAATTSHEDGKLEGSSQWRSKVESVSSDDEEINLEIY